MKSQSSRTRKHDIKTGNPGTVLTVLGFFLWLFTTGCTKVEPEPIAQAQPTPVATAPTQPMKVSKNPPAPEIEPETRPGPALGLDGKPYEVTKVPQVRELLLEGGGRLGVRFLTGVYPEVTDKIFATPSFYDGAEVKMRDSFVEVTPSKPLKATIGPEQKLKQGKGLLYINAGGTLLLTTDETPAPEGFFVIGQTRMQIAALERLKSAKKPDKVQYFAELSI